MHGFLIASHRISTAGALNLIPVAQILPAQFCPVYLKEGAFQGFED